MPETSPRQTSDPRPSRRFAPLAAAACLLSALLGAQAAGAGFLDDFMPTVEVTLHHPPSLGLTVDRVAFARADGKCAGELASLLIENFVKNGVEVIERERLDEILEEINLSLSGYIDQNDAVAIGQVLGPSALIFIDVQRCAASRDRWTKRFKNLKGESTIYYYSKTEVRLKGSLRVVDLATGRIFSAKTVEQSDSATVDSSDGYPAYPDEYEIHDRVMRRAVFQVHRMFFRWSERRSLRYFKDGKCNLEAAYQLLKIDDVEGAAQQSEANLELCKSDPKVKPKTLARAYYNVGMSHFMRNEHEQALEYFEQAYRLKGGSRIRETILECKRALQAAREMQRYEDRIALASAEGEAPAEAPPTAGLSPGTSRETTVAENASASPVADRLRQLEELLEQGLLSEEEYRAKKQEILDDL